ncbi:MAG: RsmE family RNA methyltransferase, partial [Desulfatibacillaceae bacterium]|nr:RsmE family RNA methyltransferase [Desulfatibacillaceae bacterium]
LQKTQAPKPPVQIAVACALTKGDRADTIVRMLTELGAMQIIFFESALCVREVLPQKIDKKIFRWKKIAIESVKQCRRPEIPQIGPVADFAGLLELSQAFDYKVAFWEKRAGDSDSLKKLPELERTGKILALIGPEGGFTDDEAAALAAQGFVLAGLGPRILRADTAAVAGIVLLQSLFGDMAQA